MCDRVFFLSFFFFGLDGFLVPYLSHVPYSKKLMCFKFALTWKEGERSMTSSHFSHPPSFTSLPSFLPSLPPPPCPKCLEGSPEPAGLPLRILPESTSERARAHTHPWEMSLAFHSALLNLTPHSAHANDPGRDILRPRVFIFR